jgi:hypothetical protein
MPPAIITEFVLSVVDYFRHPWRMTKVVDNVSGALIESRY